ncbi:hypothetical protein [Xanthocytophaga agilis]|uniref:Uncharacterized protein n=1 Tax=Xanthocytophaga agilis TaxID=3048010 RepID=A0AAE3R178_9BACT|nr:hypothetical protein [Xanthocytophaga agilis]MDJ1501245.1 hypothetical protein [Xanthocytophaga agilis]
MLQSSSGELYYSTSCSKVKVKRKYFYFSFVALSIFLSFCGCGSDILTAKEYKVYLSNPSNGLVQSHAIGDKLKMSVHYMPAAYLAYGDIQKSGLAFTPALLDSTLKSYAGHTTFYLTIESLSEKVDLQKFLQKDVSITLSDALNQLDMQLPEDITLQVDKQSYTPSLCIRESAPGLNHKITFVTVFPVNLTSTQAEKCILNWKDRFFQQSEFAFIFTVSDLKVTPQIRE